ncbi:MAG: hypothetical protein OSA98_17370 [Rubripirellula sp.]|nr:hypothetical protein [Rubripirellula sp.]
MSMITQFAKRSQAHTILSSAARNGKRSGRRLRSEQAGACRINRRKPQTAAPGQRHRHQDGNQHTAPTNDGGTAAVNDG